MAVEIELAGQLAARLGRKRTLDLAQPVPAAEVARALGIDLEEVGLIAINGVQSEPEDIVPLDSRLCFFPPLSGG